MRRLLPVLLLALLFISCSDVQLSAGEFVLSPYVDQTGGEFLSLSFETNAEADETLTVSVISEVSGLKWTGDAVTASNKICTLNGMACPLGFEYGDYRIEVSRATGGEKTAGTAHLNAGNEEFSLERAPSVTAQGHDGVVDFYAENLREGDSYYVRLLNNENIFISEAEISEKYKEVFYQNRRKARHFTYVWLDSASGVSYVRSGQPIS